MWFFRVRLASDELQGSLRQRSPNWVRITINKPAVSPSSFPSGEDNRASRVLIQTRWRRNNTRSLFAEDLTTPFTLLIKRSRQILIGYTWVKPRIQTNIGICWEGFVSGCKGVSLYVQASNAQRVFKGYSLEPQESATGRIILYSLNGPLLDPGYIVFMYH